MKGHGFPTDIAFHPGLPLVAVISEQKAFIFDRSTGDRLEDRLDLSVHKPEDLRRCVFSPDGRSLMVDTATSDGRCLMSYPLKLTDTERRTLSKPPARPGPREETDSPPTRKPKPSGGSIKA
jgi:hypothetical protein